MSDIRVTYCDRCGTACKVADTSNPEARILKASTVPSGWCADCATTNFLQTSPIGQLIKDPNMLLAPHARLQFAKVMLAGNADALPTEINWERVVRNWDLPFKKPSRRKKA